MPGLLFPPISFFCGVAVLPPPILAHHLVVIQVLSVHSSFPLLQIYSVAMPCRLLWHVAFLWDPCQFWKKNYYECWLIYFLYNFISHFHFGRLGQQMSPMEFYPGEGFFERWHLVFLPRFAMSASGIDHEVSYGLFFWTAALLQQYPTWEAYFDTSHSALILGWFSYCTSNKGSNLLLIIPSCLFI